MANEYNLINIDDFTKNFSSIKVDGGETKNKKTNKINKNGNQ